MALREKFPCNSRANVPGRTHWNNFIEKITPQCFKDKCAYSTYAASHATINHHGPRNIVEVILLLPQPIAKCVNSVYIDIKRKNITPLLLNLLIAMLFKIK